MSKENEERTLKTMSHRLEVIGVWLEFKKQY